MHDIVIVGAGTAGLTAALYGRRAGKSVLLIEAEAFGGQIIYSPLVENYPGISSISGTEFADGLFNQVMDLEAEVCLGKVTGIEKTETGWVVKTTDGDKEGKTVIVATGASPKTLGLDKEAEYVGQGVSYCALCDGSFYKGKVVAVAGGGNTALEEAEFLAGLASKVYLIHRRDEFRGEKSLIDRLASLPNVEFILDTEIKKLVGEKDQFGALELKALSLQNAKTGEKTELPLDGLFIAIGRAPDNKCFSGLLKMDRKGYIKAGEDCHTSQEGIFAAGDCRTKTVRQLTTAAADGAVASKEACNYIA